MADAYFHRAQGREGGARKKDFHEAGEAYAKAADLKTGDADLSFNAALAYQNGEDYSSSEKHWRETLKRRPNDVQALASLASVLAELKKFDEGIKTLHQAVVAEPKEKTLHRQLGAIYTKAGNNQKGTEELMVYLALQNGQPAADAAALAKKAPAGSQAAKTMSSIGVPEQVYPWVAEGEKWETWFYWSKRLAYHFKGGALVQKSDWTVPDLKAAASGK
jgi:tetratricopeptide (TPR) repeat protein